MIKESYKSYLYVAVFLPSLFPYADFLRVNMHSYGFHLIMISKLLGALLSL